jgi:hypothetical protein
MTATLEDMRDNVKGDLDLEDEDFITDTDVDRFINEGRMEAEKAIHDLSEDYFKTKDTLDLVTDEEEVDLPADIFADKIREISYDDGSDRYEVKRFRQYKRHVDRGYVSAEEPYMYDILNSTTDGRKLVLYPASRITNGTYMTIWYIRKSATLDTDSDELDIPEGQLFIEQYAKCQCYMKEFKFIPKDESDKLAALKASMLSALTERIPDGDDEVPADASIYDEHN